MLTATVFGIMMFICVKKLIQYRTVEHSTNATKTHHHMPGSCKKCASDEQM